MIDWYDPIGAFWYWDVLAMKRVPDIETIVLHSNNNVIGYLCISIFIYYFAVFKASKYWSQIATLVAKLLLLGLYVPLLIYCGAYVDASIIAFVLVARFAYLICFSIEYKNVQFLLFNNSELCFLFGKATPYSPVFNKFVVFTGGHHFVNFGYHFVPFIDTNNLCVSVRGGTQLDLHFSRQIELCDGSYLYLFTTEPIVSVCSIVVSTNE